ncbi:hypothetical protein [Prevotella falsenii]|uniref:hypothetical protein n=1 Tax=Prevotella falsenii TaxID=515414 RepID=UPI000467F12F|nr:hypothetical protein [Prevotella falsenii]
MKKIIVLAMVALVSTMSFAQTDNSEILRIHKKDKTYTGVLLNQINDIAFEKVEPMEMVVDVEKVTNNEMIIDFKMPEKCKKWYLKVSTEKLNGTHAELRKQITEAHNNEYTTDQYLKFQNCVPNTDYYFYILMFDEDEVPSGITEVKVTTLAVVADFEISYEVEGNEIKMNVTPAYKDSVYLFEMYTREEAPNDADVVPKLRKQIDHLVEVAQQTGFSVEDLLAEYTTKNKGEKVFKSLKENTEYVGFALYINPKTGEFLSEPVIKSVKTEKVKPSDNKITIEVSDIKPRSVEVHFKTTNKDRYAMAFFKWSGKWKTYSDEEIVDILTMPTYAQYIRIYEGDKDVQLPNLSPETEYCVVAFGYSGGVATTPLVKKFFTTAKIKVADVSFSLIYNKYYDGDELIQAYPGKFDGAEGKAVLPVKVKITGEATKFYYGLYSEDLTDPSSRTDEDLANELLTYGISDAETAFFVPYETVCTAVGYAVDAEGNHGPVYRQRIYLTKSGVSPVSELKTTNFKIKKILESHNTSKER